MFTTPTRAGGGPNDPTLSKLDRDFQFYASHAKTLMQNVVGDSERQLCTMWLTKLCEVIDDDVVVKKNRDIYLAQLLYCMARNNLEGVFLVPPPRGPLPDHTKVFKMERPARQRGQPPDWIEDVIRDDPKKQVQTHISRDGRTYLATKLLPDGGAFGYMAVSTDESGWFKPQPRITLFRPIPKVPPLPPPRPQMTEEELEADLERRRIERAKEAMESTQLAADLIKRRPRRRLYRSPTMARRDILAERSPEWHDAYLMAGGKAYRSEMSPIVRHILETRPKESHLLGQVENLRRLLGMVDKCIRTRSCDPEVKRLLEKLEEKIKNRPHMASTLALSPNRKRAELLKTLKNRFLVKIGQIERHLAVMKRLESIAKPYEPGEQEVPKESPVFDFEKALTIIGITPENLEKLTKVYTTPQIRQCQEIIREQKQKMLQGYNIEFQSVVDKTIEDATAALKPATDGVILQSDLYRSWKNLSEIIQRKTALFEREVQLRVISELPDDDRENYEGKLKDIKDLKKLIKGKQRSLDKLERQIKEQRESLRVLTLESDRLKKQIANERKHWLERYERTKQELEQEEGKLKELCENKQFMALSREIPEWYSQTVEMGKAKSFYK